MAAVAWISLISVILFSFSTTTVCVASHQHVAPAPAVECSSLILNLADCLSFVSTGSTVAKPEGSCCYGLKTVLQANAECLCVGLKNSASLGVTLNVTKAATLPEACKLNAPSVAKCGLSASPAAAPGVAPGAAAGPKSEGANAPAPTPAKGNYASSLVPVSVTSVVSSVLVLLFFSL